MEMAQDSTPDRLSNLPDNILQIIFSGFSIREVVRTSVLSTNWRSKWLTFPNLIFNDECIPGSVGSVGHSKLVEILNHVLRVPRSPVRTFKLSSSYLESCSEIDTWIFNLMLDPVKEFELQISQGSHLPHSLPQCIFSFNHLNRLTLVRCVIPEPPSSFNSFPFLTTLFLQSVTLLDATLKCLLSSCPELESLTLENIDGPTYIELRNPKLKYVSVSAEPAFFDICQELKLLVYARIDAWPNPDLRFNFNFLDFFSSLRSIQELCLGSSFLQWPLDGSKKIPYIYRRLKSFSFHLSENYETGISFALSVLHCTPNLQKLKIVFSSSSESSILLQETKNRLENMGFKTLRVVNFDGFCGLKIQLLVIKLLLANSPVLETMTINPSSMDFDKELTLLKELLQYERTSPRARIVYY